MTRITNEELKQQLDEIRSLLQEQSSTTGDDQDREADVASAPEANGVVIRTQGDCERPSTIIYQSSKETLREAVLEAISEGVDLDGANLVGVDLSGADLSRAEFPRVNFRYANLSEANLSGTNLAEAQLSSANLSHANLVSARLQRTELAGANLSGADLCSARFYGRGGRNSLKRSQLPDFLGALGFVIEKD